MFVPILKKKKTHPKTPCV